MKDYVARCTAADTRQIVWFEAGHGESDSGVTADIAVPERLPSAGPKESYNLYWAACHGVFRKFK
ncbi:MAG: hypothetical protein QOF41_425 [Methylobacteriaceae bacterium]|nr:hypothetical protein [Methylobacteriaceae bacterium]